MTTFRTETDLEAFEAFVLAHGGIYMQSAKWAQVKLEWKSRFYAGFGEAGERVLTALVLERQIPMVGRIWYCPAGAVCDYGDAALLTDFAAFMKKELKAAGAAALFFDPCVALRINGEKQAFGVETHRALLEAGFRLNPDAAHCVYKSPVQLMLPLKNADGTKKTPESLLKGFEKGVRYSVRVGENRGLTEEIYTIGQIERDPEIMRDFAAVMRDTSDRNDFVERDTEYDKRLLRVFGDGMEVELVYYDKEKDAALQAARLKRRAELEAALPTAPEKKLRGIREEMESIDKQTEHFEERVRETEAVAGRRVCVAGGMTVHYNGMSSCLFGGARNLLRNNLRASHYFNFRRICRSIALGNDVHDLGYVLLKTVPPDADGTLGPCVPNEEFEGICAFKKSFSADYVEYIGEYVLVGNAAKYFSYVHLIDKARAAQSVLNRVVKKRR